MTPRFRSLTPDAERKKEDEIAIDLERFEAELNASMARLDGKPPPAPPAAVATPKALPPLERPVPAAGTGTPTAPSTPRAPVVAPAPLAPSAPPATPPISNPTTQSRAGFDLLSELRQAAAEKALAGESDEVQRKARIERTEVAMRGLFRYLGEFCSHLNKIQLALPQIFRPLPNIELAGLHWTDSSLDYRTDGGTETSPLDTVSLRYTLSAGDRIQVEKLPNFSPAYLDELKRVGLRFTVTEKRSSRGLVESSVFSVERAIVVTLLFKADSSQETISVQARNFTGLGYATYRIKVSDLDQTTLDQLGLHILGRPSQLFQRLIKE